MDWNLNFWAVLVAAAIHFGLGWAWFSVLFGKPWMALVQMSPADMEKGRGQMPVLFGGAAVVALIMAFVLAVLVHKMQIHSAWGAVKLGLAVGIGMLAAPMLSSYTFKQQPMKLYLLEIGYPVLSTVIMSVVLALWW